MSHTFPLTDTAKIILAPDEIVGAIITLIDKTQPWYRRKRTVYKWDTNNRYAFFNRARRKYFDTHSNEHLSHYGWRDGNFQMYEMFYAALSYDTSGVVAVLQQFDTLTYDEKIEMYTLFFNYVEMFVDSFLALDFSSSEPSTTALESLRKNQKALQLGYQELERAVPHYD